MNANSPVLLDCTLRDGGNQNNWGFTQEHANQIVERLDKAHVDVIEVGYRGGSGSRRDPSAGLSFESSASYIRALPPTAYARLAVMVVPSVCHVDELDTLASLGVDVIRIAAYPWDLQLTEPFIVRAKSLGMTTSLNLMAVSYLEAAELGQLASGIRYRPDVFYIADSFGALHPEGVAERVSALIEHASTEVGIHVHNNLGLAAANTLAALEAGATWADASLCSMARGAGNLATEQLVALLQTRRGWQTAALLGEVCAAAQYVASNILKEPMRLGPDEIAAGVNNHHYFFQPLIREESARYGVDPLEVGRALGLSQPQSVKRENVVAICEDLVRFSLETEEGALL